MIVVGVSDTSHGEAAARRAVDLAERLGEPLRAVHVAHVPASMVAALATMPAPSVDFAAAQRAAVWERMGPILDAAEGGPVERVELEGYPADTLVEYAEQVGADLVVVGSRGRGDIASLVLGSISHRVLHLAQCDVLIVRAQEG